MSDSIETLSATTALTEVQAALGGSDWLVELRAAARERFNALDWPSTREEEWRRTNLSPFEFDTYRPTISTAEADVASADGSRLDYENGRLVACGVGEEAAQAGVSVGDLSELSNPNVVDRVEGVLKKALSTADNRIVAWHLALLNDVAVVHLPAGVILREPLFVDVSVSGDEKVCAPHLVVIAERGSQATVVRTVRGRSDEGEMLVLDGADLVVEENARLTIVAAQFLNDESVYFNNDTATIARDGYLKRTEAALGSDFVKSRLTCDVIGPGADAAINGLYFAMDEQHMDIRTVQHHAAPRTTSRSYYRGAVRDEGHAIYQGLIQVEGSAPGTDAYLTNKNLILAEAARADSIPSLNIQTDDVRCSHGSTTGRLDPGEIFYLQSRGFPQDEARKMLIQGYFEDLIEDLPETVSEEIRGRIASRVPE